MGFDHAVLQAGSSATFSSRTFSARLSYTGIYRYALLLLLLREGNKGNVSCTVALLRRRVGLQHGLPVGLLTRWTICLANLPTETLPCR